MCNSGEASYRVKASEAIILHVFILDRWSEPTIVVLIINNSYNIILVI